MTKSNEQIKEEVIKELLDKNGEIDGHYTKEAISLALQKKDEEIEVLKKKYENEEFPHWEEVAENNYKKGYEVSCQDIKQKIEKLKTKIKGKEGRCPTCSFENRPKCITLSKLSHWINEIFSEELK